MISSKQKALSPAGALIKAFYSQLNPKMLYAILMPFLVALGSAIILLIYAWTPLNSWLYQSATQWQWFQSLYSVWGMPTISSWLSGFISFISLVAISGIAGLTAAAILVTPMAVKLLSKNNYPELERRGDYVNTVSIANAIKVSTIFIVGWIITIPLWLIPFASIALSLFWGAYAFSQIAKVDSIVEHASPAERQHLLKKNKQGYWIIGLTCSAISFIPFMGFIMPVYAILACTHYSLSSLSYLRSHPEPLTLEQAKVINTKS